GERSAPRRDHALQRRWLGRAALRDGPQERGRPRGSSQHRRALGDGQRARLARRRPAARLHHRGQGRRFLRLARVFRGRWPGRPRLPRAHERRAVPSDDAPDDRDPGALGAARPRVLYGRAVPAELPREPLRRVSRLMEPHGPDRLQDRARAVQGRPAERPRRGLRDGMARGPAGEPRASPAGLLVHSVFGWSRSPTRSTPPERIRARSPPPWRGPAMTPFCVRSSRCLQGSQSRVPTMRTGPTQNSRSTRWLSGTPDVAMLRRVSAAESLIPSRWPSAVWTPSKSPAAASASTSVTSRAPWLAFGE